MKRMIIYEPKKCVWIIESWLGGVGHIRYNKRVGLAS